uniref:Uncharacterized protein n=1 Tax=Avena sativa TaxID=4498 RepID=A0ACD5YWC4_AVESA
MAAIVQLLAVILLHLCIASCSFHLDHVQQSEQGHDYLRFADVSRHCQSVLSSATELPYDPNRPGRLKRELSFEKGDWRQDAGKAPLVPFDGDDAPKNGARRLLDPLSLATFLVTHVGGGDEEHRARAAVNVSGVLLLSIGRKDAVPGYGPHMSALLPEFNLSAGSTTLKIIFEGVYMERAKRKGEEDDDGEQVLCMVGSAVLPKRGADGVDPWGLAKNSARSSVQPPVTSDNNILLVLRYPKKLTLTTRAVLGKMESTGSASDAAYFDTVRLVSAFISCCSYNFHPEELPAGLGDALPSRRSDADNGGARDVYNGSNPCVVLSRYAREGQALTVLPGWHCSNSTTGTPCHSIGPFEMGREADADMVAGVRIIMQDLQCQEQHGHGTAMVSVVFRALSPWEDQRNAIWRSGLSGKTLSAEGLWNASTGHACMVACRGTAKACDFRVCLYFPTTMSITRLDAMLGQINGVDAAGGVAGPPLVSFRQHIGPRRFSGYYPDDGKPLVQYKYSYTKVKQAGELRQRSGSAFDFRKMVASYLPLSYPKIDGAGGVGDRRRSFSTLADRLTLCFLTVPGLFRHESIERPVLHLEVVSLEHLTGRYMPPRHISLSDMPRQEPPRSEGHPLLNVSAELTIFQDHWPQDSVMSLEGVYDPDDGRMHLIGCRDIHLRRLNSSASRDLELEQGMDCSIEVKVEYPPTTMHYFIMSTAKVQIASTRAAVDPLRFDALKLRALPVIYPQEQPGGFYRGVANGVLCIVLLSASLAAVLSQLRYLKSHADVAPYISQAMLTVQALGYGMPLVTGVEAILARVTLRSPGYDAAAAAPSSARTPYYMFDSGRLCETIEQVVKVLSLCTLLLTLRLGQKVRRSRARMLARSPLDPARVPSDGKVLVYHYGVHLVLFLLILALNREAVTAEQQVALMHDLFLLPQAIGNAVWRVNCRPLRGSFYAGVTALRVLPHVYDYVRRPAAAVVGGARYSGEREFADAAGAGRFFGNAGDVVIPLVAVVLALVVHAQQRWNYAIVSRMGKPEQKKLQHIF